jgi:hypothetical protein
MEKAKPALIVLLGVLVYDGLQMARFKDEFPEDGPYSLEFEIEKKGRQLVIQPGDLKIKGGSGKLYPAASFLEGAPRVWLYLDGEEYPIGRFVYN